MAVNGEHEPPLKVLGNGIFSSLRDSSMWFDSLDMYFYVIFMI